MASESGPQGPDLITADEAGGEIPEVARDFIPDDIDDMRDDMRDEMSDDMRDDMPVAAAPHVVPDIAEYYGAEVTEELRNEPWNFQFFQAVRLLERLGERKA